MSTNLPTTREIKEGDIFTIRRNGVPLAFDGNLVEQYVLEAVFADPSTVSSFEEANWVAKLGLLDAMVVEGADNSPEVNGTYLRDGDFNSAPRYTIIGGTSTDDSIVRGAIQDWAIFSSGSPLFNQAVLPPSVSSPDLVGTWSVVDGSGTAPAPTVRRATWPEYIAALLEKNGASLASLIVATSTPASATATGIAGQITWDADYIYVCTATNTWKRVGISTW